MALQINQYTKIRTDLTLDNDDLMDLDSTDDAGVSYESAKMTIGNLLAFVNANADNIYIADGTIGGNRTLTANGNWTKWLLGDVKVGNVGDGDSFGFVVELGVVEMGRFNYDVPSTSANIELKHFILGVPTTYFKAINGNVGIGIATPTSKLHVQGGTPSTTKTLLIENSLLNPNFYVQDDGVVSSRVGYSIDGVKYFHNNGVVNNTFAGSLCGENVTGIGNTAMGRAALWVHTTGISNTAIGSSALQSTTIGTRNTAIGTSSLVALNSTAGNDDNTGIGQKTLQQLITGNKNTALGSNAGGDNTGGLANTFIGYLSKFDVSASYNYSIALGFSSEITASNQFVIGSNGTQGINEMYIGRGVSGASASLGDFTIQTTGVSDGITDGSSANSVFNIAGARGTGTGTGGDIILKTAPAGTTGSTQNPLVEALRVKESGVLNISNIPTSAAGLSAGDIWSNAGVLNIV